MFGLNGLNSLVFPKEITIMSHLNVDMPESEIRTREMTPDNKSDHKRKAKRAREEGKSIQIGVDYPDHQGKTIQTYLRGKYYDIGSLGLYHTMTARDKVMDWSMSTQSCTTPAQSPTPSSKQSTSHKSLSLGIYILNAKMLLFILIKLNYSSKFEKLVNRQKMHKPNGGPLGAPSVKI